MKKILSLLALIILMPLSVGADIYFFPKEYSVSEGAGSVNINMVTNHNSGPLTVTFRTANGTASGTDYDSVVANRNWPMGPISWTVPVTINDDSIGETEETINLTVTAVDENGIVWNVDQAIIKIIDNDGQPPAVRLKSSAMTVNENDPSGRVELTIERLGDTSTFAYAEIQSRPITAMDPVDFNPFYAQLSWNAGDAADKTISITIHNDSLVENTETFEVNLRAIQNVAVESPSTALVTILDDDRPAGNAGWVVLDCPLNVSESIGNAVCTLTREGGSQGPVSIEVGTSEILPWIPQAGIIYTPVSGTVAFADGELAPKSFSFSIPILNDTISGQPPNRGFSVGVGNPTGGLSIGERHSAPIFVLDDDLPAGYRFDLASYNAGEGAGNLSVFVERTGDTSQPGEIWVKTNDGTARDTEDFVGLPPQGQILTWPAGNSNPILVSVSMINDNISEPTENFTLTLINPANGTIWPNGTAVVSLLDDDPVVPTPTPTPPAPNAGTSLPSKNLVDLSKNEQAEFQTELPSAGHLEIVIYDRFGKKVTDFLSVDRPAGAYRDSWNGRDSDGRLVAAGVYHALIKKGRSVRKLSLIVLK